MKMLCFIFYVTYITNLGCHCKWEIVLGWAPLNRIGTLEHTWTYFWFDIWTYDEGATDNILIFHISLRLIFHICHVFCIKMGASYQANLGGHFLLVVLEAQGDPVGLVVHWSLSLQEVQVGLQEDKPRKVQSWAWPSQWIPNGSWTKLE